MSEPTTPTPGAQPAAEPTTPTQGGQPAAEPAQPFATFDTEKSFMTRVNRDARKQMNEFAKEQGFSDWAHLSETLNTLRQGAGGQQPAQPPAQPTPQGPSEADRLRMALTVGAKLNLPAALVGRLQGTTAEEMEADAQALVSLMGQGQQRAPGIPPAPSNGQPVTFTVAQLQDPKFVREHEAEIRRAHAEGRIVRS